MQFCRSAILLVLGAFACSPSSPSESPQVAAPDSSDFQRIASVKRGMPRQEVVATLGQALTHEFTKTIDGALIECGSCRFGPDHMAWYYAFRDGRLERVVEMPFPTFATETLANGSRYSQRITKDPMGRLARTYAVPDLLVEGAMVESLELRLHAPHGESNLAPILPVLLPILEADARRIAPERARQEELNRRLSELLDGWKIPIGMTRRDVVAALGDGRPLESNESGVVRRLWVPEGTLTLIDGRIRVAPLLVQFREERVETVLGGCFAPVVGD